MGEWAQLANTTGVALAVLAAIGFAAWRLGTLITHKLFGNPDANPPRTGLVDVYLAQQKEFFDSLKGHTAAQQLLCERHATSLEAISNVLSTHDVAAAHRTVALDDLMKLHSDDSIPGSTAEAIKHVRQLRDAAIATCGMCRSLASGDHAEEIRKHCDGIEAIFEEDNRARVRS